MACTRRIARLGVLALLTLGACSGGDEMTQTVWDFSTPLTPIDLGSDVKDFHELEGDVDLEVVFPTGRVVQGRWDSGARAEAFAASDAAPQPVNEVLLFDAPATDIDDLRASADRFVETWGSGSGTDGTIEDFIARTAELAQQGDTPFGELYPAGRNVKAFDAAEQDGLRPTWVVRFNRDVVTIRTVIAFDPASG